MQNLLLTDSPSALLLLFPDADEHYLLSVDRLPYALGIETLSKAIHEDDYTLFVLWLSSSVLPHEINQLLQEKGGVDLNIVIGATFSDIVEALADEESPPPPERLEELADVIQQARNSNLIPDRFHRAYLFIDQDVDQPEFYRFKLFDNNIDHLFGTKDQEIEV